MKLAIAHDFIRHGGAERVLEEMHDLWPDAPIFTLFAEEHARYADWDVRSSWLQSWLPPAKYRWPLPLYPGMVDRLSRELPSDLDLLLTSSVSWMKSLRAPAGVPHLCYLYRPMMFAYERQADFLAGYPAPLRPILRALIQRIRRWDQRRAVEPTLYVAISEYIAGLVEKHYGRKAAVVYPPVDLERFEHAGRACSPGESFLTVLRLESYKRVDVVVRACTERGLPLRVAGRGPELDRLREMAGPTVEFLGFVSEEELPGLVASCRAFLFPAEEDFGISPVEAMAAGRPVVAYAAGGALETVKPGLSGLHFPEQTPAALGAALDELDRQEFEASRIAAWARRFSVDAFREGLHSIAEGLVAGADPAELAAHGGARAGGSGVEPAASPQ